MTFLPIRTTDDPLWAKVMVFYRTSFPPGEQRSDEDYAAALADPAFQADAILVDGRTAGLLFHWRYDDGSYIEHLAVAPAMRNRHLGADVLAEFCRGRRVVLEIDPPESEIARRRKGFYERAGFVANPHPYVHPSYGDPAHAHRLVLMSRPAPLENDEVRRFANFVRERVLRYSGIVDPELPRWP